MKDKKKIIIKILNAIIYIIIGLSILFVFYETVKGEFVSSKIKNLDNVAIKEDNILGTEEVRKISRIDLVKEILKYNNIVAYKELGRCYNKELPITKELEFDINIDSYDGVDSLGFVDWCFRFATGKALDNIEFPFSLYNTSEKVVSIKDLKIGDIGYGNMDSEIRNVFGIFIGYYDDIPIFATCRYSPFDNMEWGGLQIAYLKSETNEKLDKAEPVDLKYFIRPNIEWLEGTATVSIVKTNQGLKVDE